MKTPLKDLVRQRNKTREFHFFDKEHEIDAHLNYLHEAVSSNLGEQIFRQQVSQHHENISVELAKIRLLVNQQLQIFEQEIRAQDDEYFERSQQIYDGTIFDEPDYIMGRNKGHHFLKSQDGNVRELFLSRLGQYNDWRKPGLQIHPTFGKITDYIKGCDPLYLLDTSNELLMYVKTQFTEAYQRRLRYYTFNERANDPLHMLPKKQFGLIVVTDWFNYKTMQMTVKYLKHFMDLLCDGGVVVFTYNNCDLPEAVERVDNGFQTYIPGQLLQEIVSELGYEIIKFIDAGGTASWAEIKKPGEIETVRGGQTLAEIRSFVQNP
jgi:hypothetical protein